jgi:photosystem II stability/assembly factor-like uncharacterized protein
VKTIKRIFLNRTKWILSLSAVLGAVLLICYGAFAQARRGDARNGTKALASRTDGESLDREYRENDPEFVERRREWLDRFLARGPTAVSPAAYAEALAATRSLPTAPLTQTWTFQALSPLWNDWGGLGGNCTIPYPDPDHSYCGASARIDAIAVDPMNADIVYVGSEGGLSKSTDGGQHWTYLSDGLASQSVRSIAIDPVAGNIIYVGTGMNERFGVGIYRSVDSGATWKLFGKTEFSGGKIVKIAIDPATAGSQTSTTLYASVTRPYPDQTHRVWKSTNSGASWTQVRSATAAGGGFTLYDIVIQPGSGLAPSTVYITAPDGVFRGIGNGTWTQIHSIPHADVTSSLALSQSTLNLAFKASDGSTTIVRSTDQGSNWTELSRPCAPNPPWPDLCADLFTFGVNPADPNQIFIGGGWVLVYSLDAGITWEWAHEVHVDNHSIAFCPSNPQRNYLGTDGGIYRADYGDPICTNHPMCWYSKNQNFAGCLMQGVSISSDNHMVQGNQDNGTQYGYLGRNPPWRSTNPGTGDGGRARIDHTNSSKFYFTGYACSVGSGHPYRTTDGGATSVSVTPPGALDECSSFFPAMFMSPASSARVIMGFRNVWRTTDSGNSWVRIGGIPCARPSPTPSCDISCHTACGIEPSPTPGTVNGIYEAPSDPNVIYVYFDGGRAWVTRDANQGNNAHWTPCMAGMPWLIYAVTVDPSNPNTAYFAGDRGVYKTTDYGQSYTQVAIPDLIYRDVVIDPANRQHLFAAFLGGVLSSTDGGLTWSDMSAGIPAGMAVTSLSLNGTSRKLAASTYGRGAYILDLGELRQAESGVLTGCYIQADPNASGGYRVDGIDAPGDNVAFTNFPQTTQITIRYASPNTGTFGLYVNGTRVASILITSTGPPSGGWTIFTEKVVNVAIPANATVKLEYDTGDVAINLDYIIIAR